MKILVVSGFLGAGKTTFIKTLSKKIDKKIAVLENDYAAVNIDEEILKNQTDLSVWEQTEKCICCTGKSDFAMDILTISNTLNPDFLIVEPTGVGYLSKVIANIQKIEYEQISLLSPVTVVDPSAFSNCLKNYGELYQDHIKYAGTIVLSKCDLHLDSLALEETISKIKELNPTANIIQSHYAYQGEEFWQGLFIKHLDGSGRGFSEKILTARLRFRLRARMDCLRLSRARNLKALALTTRKFLRLEGLSPSWKT